MTATVRLPNRQIRCAKRFVSLKCTIAEVAWIQREIGGPVGPLDWATKLHRGKAPKTWERSWERFKANLIKWDVPHEKIPTVTANVTQVCRNTVAMYIRLKLAPEDLDEWFWRRWGVPEPGDEYLYTLWCREQRELKKKAEREEREESRLELEKGERAPGGRESNDNNQ